MNWKRYALAVGVAVLAALVLDVLVNAVLMRQAFIDSARYWLPADELNRRVPLGFAALGASMAFLALAFVWSGRVGLRAGLQFGVFLALAAVAGTAGLASLVPWPISLIGSMATQQALNNLVLGLSLGLLYRPSRLPAV